MKRYFRIVVKCEQPLWFDMEVPPDANLVNFWQNIKFAGSVVHENFAIPYEQIKYICIVTQEQAAQVFTPRVVN